MNVTKERYKLFENKAKEFYSSFEKQECFLVGAVWADQHPQKGLVDVEKACDYITKNVDKYAGYDVNVGGYVQTKEFIEDLRNAMLGENNQ